MTMIHRTVPDSSIPLLYLALVDAGAVGRSLVEHGQPVAVLFGGLDRSIPDSVRGTAEPD